MNTSIEISLYPLDEQYKKLILDFLARVRQYSDIRVETNSMSTQIFGDYDQIISIVASELKPVFEQYPAVAVMKIIGRSDEVS